MREYFLHHILLACLTYNYPQIYCFMLHWLNIHRYDGNTHFRNEFCNWTNVNFIKVTVFQLGCDVSMVYIRLRIKPTFMSYFLASEDSLYSAAQKCQPNRQGAWSIPDHPARQIFQLTLNSSSSSRSLNTHLITFLVNDIEHLCGKEANNSLRLCQYITAWKPELTAPPLKKFTTWIVWCKTFYSVFEAMNSLLNIGSRCIWIQNSPGEFSWSRNHGVLKSLSTFEC